MVKGTSVAAPMTIKADKSTFTDGLLKQCNSAEMVPSALGTGAVTEILIIGIFAAPKIFLQLETMDCGSHLDLHAGLFFGGPYGLGG